MSQKTKCVTLCNYLALSFHFLQVIKKNAANATSPVVVTCSTDVGSRARRLFPLLQAEKVSHSGRLCPSPGQEAHPPTSSHTYTHTYFAERGHQSTVSMFSISYTENVSVSNSKIVENIKNYFCFPLILFILFFPSGEFLLFVLNHFKCLFIFNLHLL